MTALPKSAQVLNLVRQRWFESSAFLGVLAICVAVRVVELGSIPRIITGDEVDNLQSAYRIVDGMGPGLLGFDWKPAPILGLYPLAWSVHVFGNTVSDFRMYPVIFSLLTIVLFYLLARESMGVLAALGAMVLLGTNLWFLNFSRTAWDNMNAACFAVGACWTLTRALKTQRLGWWAAVGLFVAGGLYGYFSARFIFISVALACSLAIALKQAPWRQTMLGLGLAGVLAGALFAPMSAKIASDWSTFNRRTNNVSVFHVGDAGYEGDTNSWVILWKNMQRNYRGFVLQDSSQMQRGYWQRYGPLGRPPLDLVTTHLFWAGLIVGAVAWRKTYLWWPFFIPLFVAEVFSTGTPDLARGIVFAPFYFLFVGILFEWLLHLSRRPMIRAVMGLGLALAIGLVAVFNVKDYFDWQTSTATQELRLPGVDRCEFSLFEALARPAVSNGSAMDPNEFLRLREQLNCSPIVRRAAAPH